MGLRLLSRGIGGPDEATVWTDCASLVRAADRGREGVDVDTANADLLDHLWDAAARFRSVSVQHVPSHTLEAGCGKLVAPNIPMLARFGNQVADVLAEMAATRAEVPNEVCDAWDRPREQAVKVMVWITACALVTAGDGPDPLLIQRQPAPPRRTLEQERTLSTHTVDRATRGWRCEGCWSRPYGASPRAWLRGLCGGLGGILAHGARGPHQSHQLVAAQDGEARWLGCRACVRVAGRLAGWVVRECTPRQGAPLIDRPSVGRLARGLPPITRGNGRARGQGQGRRGRGPAWELVVHS